MMKIFEIILVALAISVVFFVVMGSISVEESPEENPKADYICTEHKTASTSAIYCTK